MRCVSFPLGWWEVFAQRDKALSQTTQRKYILPALLLWAALFFGGSIRIEEITTYERYDASGNRLRGLGGTISPVISLGLSPITLATGGACSPGLTPTAISPTWSVRQQHSSSMVVGFIPHANAVYGTAVGAALAVLLACVQWILARHVWLWLVFRYRRELCAERRAVVLCAADAIRTADSHVVSLILISVAGFVVGLLASFAGSISGIHTAAQIGFAAVLLFHVPVLWWRAIRADVSRRIFGSQLLAVCSLFLVTLSPAILVVFSCWWILGRVL